jgi:hypothetical protein
VLEVGGVLGGWCEGEGCGGAFAWCWHGGGIYGLSGWLKLVLPVLPLYCCGWTFAVSRTAVVVLWTTSIHSQFTRSWCAPIFVVMILPSHRMNYACLSSASCSTHIFTCVR